MTAWLGTAMKSSQPRRSASCRSDNVMVRITGAAAASAAAGVVALPGTVVGMAVSLTVGGDAFAKARGSLVKIAIADQARREDTCRPCRELNPGCYANPLQSLLTLR